MSEPTADFSFDLYPGLDRELEDIYARNVEHGLASPEAVATAGLAATVGNTLQQAPNLHLSPEVEQWAKDELREAMLGWTSYDHLLVDRLPGTIDHEGLWAPDLAHFEDTLKHLYEAKQAMAASNELTPDGLNLGETMHLAYIPWQAFRNNLNNLPGWIKRLRTAQRVATQDDYFNPDLWSAIQSNKAIYDDPKKFNNWLSAEEYLDQKIEQDGAWGIMLVQTSEQAGLKRLVDGAAEERSPNALTANGTDNFVVADQIVGALGIFEWLALTFQEDPKTLSPSDVSWLLANRIEVNGLPHVPYGSWDGGRVESGLNSADDQDDDVRPRLAVM